MDRQKGARKEVTDWVRLAILDGKQAVWAAKNTKGGDITQVEGCIGNKSYKMDG